MHKEPVYLSAERIAAIARENVMTKLVKKKWMFWEEDATAYCEVMESFLIDNDMDSMKLQTVSPKSYSKMFGSYSSKKEVEIADSWLLFGDDEEELTAKLMSAMKGNMPNMKWMNIVNAAHHENADVGRLMESVVEKEKLVEINKESQETMLGALRKKRSMTFSEIEYIRLLVKRATDREWAVCYGSGDSKGYVLPKTFSLKHFKK